MKWRYNNAYTKDIIHLFYCQKATFYLTVGTVSVNFSAADTQKPFVQKLHVNQFPLFGCELIDDNFNFISHFNQQSEVVFGGLLYSDSCLLKPSSLSVSLANSQILGKYY